MSHRNKWPKFFISAALGAVIGYTALPLQDYLNLNLFAAIEPYIYWQGHIKPFQIFNAFAAPYFFFPFYAFLGFLIASPIVRRLEALFRGIGKGKSANETTAAAKSENRGFRRSGSFFAKAFILGFKSYLVLAGSFVLIGLIFGLVFVFEIVKRPGAAVACIKTCNQCHGCFRPFNNNETEEVWEITVDRMSRHSVKSGMPFPVEKRGEIVELIKAVRSYSDKRLIRSKCIRCHLFDNIFEKKRTGREWFEVVDRIQRKMPFYISKRQANQIAKALAHNEKTPTPEPPLGSEERRELDIRLDFERRCGTCHTLDIVLQDHIRPESWKDIMIRMGEKEPDYLSSAEALTLIPVVKNALESEKNFTLTFPHSLMRERMPKDEAR